MELINTNKGNFPVLENTDGDIKTCIKSIQNGEYTLCGTAFDSSPDFEDQWWIDCKSKGPITCEKCIEIIQYCKSIKLSQLKK